MNYFFIFVIIVPCLCYTFAECPPENVIRPCTCDMGFFPVIQCGYITEMETLFDVFARSGDRKFKEFVLFNSSIQYLPVTAVSTKKFEDLLLANVSMTAFFDDLPNEDNEIGMIILENVIFLRGVSWELFGPMKKLKLFSAEDTGIRSLDQTFVDNINSGLTNLVLKNTKTKKIELNAFAHLTELFDLEIVNSEIKFIQRSMFANPSALKEIKFSGNQIESLPDDIFSNMPELRKVYLENNKLTIVSEAVFGNVIDQIGSFLFLKGNPFICDCRVLWLVSKRKKNIAAYCAAPEDQKGKYIASMTTEDLNYCR